MLLLLPPMQRGVAAVITFMCQSQCVPNPHSQFWRILAGVQQQHGPASFTAGSSLSLSDSPAIDCDEPVVSDAAPCCCAATHVATWKGMRGVWGGGGACGDIGKQQGCTRL
jgi:hypothetical protein